MRGTFRKPGPVIFISICPDMFGTCSRISASSAFPTLVCAPTGMNQFFSAIGGPVIGKSPIMDVKFPQ